MTGPFTGYTRGWRRAAMAGLCVLCAGWMMSPAAAAEPPGFAAYECTVVVSDPYKSESNDEELFRSTLPTFTRSARTMQPGLGQTDPQPAGIVAFSGSPVGGVDVMVRTDNGTFDAAWPPADTMSGRAFWRNLTLTNQTERLQVVSEGHWFGPLRDVDGLLRVSGTEDEAFLVYDVKPSRVQWIRLGRDDAGRYTVSNLVEGAEAPSVTVYVPEGEGVWRATRVAPPTADEPVVTTNAMAATNEVPAAPGEESATGTNAPVAAVSNATPAVPDVPAEPVSMVYTGRTAVGAAWREVASSAGLPDALAEYVGQVVATHGLDDEELTAVLELRPKALEAVTTLEIYPPPRRVVREGILILRNVDPGIGDEIKALIPALGDDSWEVREKAFARLGELGQAAKAALTEALDSDDMEIVYRAERLLKRLENSPAVP